MLRLMPFIITTIQLLSAFARKVPLDEDADIEVIKSYGEATLIQAVYHQLVHDLISRLESIQRCKAAR